MLKNTERTSRLRKVWKVKEGAILIRKGYLHHYAVWKLHGVATHLGPCDEDGMPRKMLLRGNPHTIKKN